MSELRNYPVPRPERDPRFTLGLAFDLSDVLQKHGYPELTGSDLLEMQTALFRFLYGDGSERSAS